MNAEMLFDEIKKMENSERIKLLDLLFDEYYDNRPPREIIVEEKIRSAWGEDDG